MTPERAFRLATRRPPLPAPLLLLRKASYEPRPEGSLREEPASPAGGDPSGSWKSFSSMMDELCTTPMLLIADVPQICTCAISKHNHQLQGSPGIKTAVGATLHEATRVYSS